MANADGTVMVDGSINFDGGVDSIKPATIASQQNPDGLGRNQLAWLVNGTVRDGGISPRAGWQPVCEVLTAAILAQILSGTSGYQGGYLYQPQQGNPYLIFSFSGEIYKVDLETLAVTNLSSQFSLHNPGDVAHGYFVQGEQFLVIQAGDGVTLPLFWDGTTLRRSAGLVPPPAPAPPPNPLFISSASQSFTVPRQFSVFGVVQGGAGSYSQNPNTLTMTWPSIGTLAVGDSCQIKATQTDNNGPSFGIYQIVQITGTTITIVKTDANNAPFRVSGINCSLYYTTTPTSTPPTFTAELPAGYAMEYFMQRIWYVYGDQRTYTAGDIVGNTASGTAKYNFTDSILKVTENPLAIGGDGFHIPSTGGNIRALKANGVLNAAMGQGQLFIFTRKQIYALQVPVSRSDWINANAQNAPLQTVVQLTNGSTGDRSITGVNGDLYYQSLEPAIRSLIIAMRYFDQPGNIPISSPENRILQFNNRELLSFATGVEFNNRLIQSALPVQMPQGVAHKALLPLDFTPVSEPGSTQPPVWEGHYEGLPFLQLLTADFGGLQRTFAPIVSEVDGSIWIWELTQGSLTENGDSRITWQIEFPAFTWGQEFDLKRLVGGELWVDRLSGTVDFALDYRQDGSACYIPWHKWNLCSARDCNETIPPSCVAQKYPSNLPFGFGYRQTLGFPKPPTVCDSQMKRPSDIAHQFQPRLTIHGYCRIRGIFLHATKVDRRTYDNLTC